MNRLGWVWLPLALALLGYGFYDGFYLVPPDAAQGEVWRIFYYHFAQNICAFLWVLVNFGASIVFLAVRNSNPARAQRADALALSTATVSVVFISAGLVTGMLWAKPIWGIWWTWDERLTSYLMLWLIYVSYLLLRRFTNEGQGQTLSAVLAIFGGVDVPIVYMSTRWWRTQHPSPVIGGGPNSGLDASMWPPVLWNLAGWFAFGVFVTWMRYRLEVRRQQFARQEMLAAAGITDSRPHPLTGAPRPYTQHG